MLLKLESRGEISRSMLYATPLIAVVLTLITGFFLFVFLLDPSKNASAFDALYTFFVDPVIASGGIAELLVKATPIILCAIGLSMGFRANVWNIGAEGQFVIGAITGTIVVLAFYDVESVFILPMMMVAGTLGGMAWAAIPAFLRTRFNTNEILVSLMLTYVAVLVLSWAVHGPMIDPDGFNFPQTRLFHDSALLPIIWEGTRLHLGAALMLLVVLAAWLIISRHLIGFQIRVIGMAPKAASYAGFKEKKLIWLTLLVSGGLAGFAGILEAAGPAEQLVPTFPQGYGFTAIIVAFLGRLHPVGIFMAGLLMALTYLGGENAQIMLGMPKSVTGVFQGMLLFYLLATDVLIRYRVRIGSAVAKSANA
ncbi:nucleoside ABC transporter membrane protein [Aestuariispira insulae]|uniref:Nucleoside ABC transporter membrane protein n=1 Tax=Aestuariispira insulae TaxID=1461337 RepID=A0A3D9HWR3_9PROT|nr:nucleoside ABC transporter membrane protein [Aestuariispira insulae]